MEGATSFAKQCFSVSPLTKAVVPIHAIPVPSPSLTNNTTVLPCTIFMPLFLVLLCIQKGAIKAYKFEHNNF